MYGGNIGNLWECYVYESCPAMEGDQVIIDTELYSVQDIRVEGFGNLAYKRLTIVKSGNSS